MLTDDQKQAFALLEKSVAPRDNRDDWNATLSILVSRQEQRIQKLERELANYKQQLDGFIAFFNTTGVNA